MRTQISVAVFPSARGFLDPLNLHTKHRGIRLLDVQARPGNGAFHKVSLRHLQHYLNEFSFRFNKRKAVDLFGMTVRRMALAGNLPYATLIEENAFTPFVRPTK
jgi:hypothetical protein